MQPHSSTIALYVAIDIGKNVHCFAAYAGAEMKVVQAPQEVLAIACGYEQFRSWLQARLAEGRYGPVIIGLEPTGIYHENWLDALLRDFGETAQVRLLNTYSVRQKRQELVGRRKKKSDALDDRAIAFCLRDGLGYPGRAREPLSLRFSLWASSVRQTQQVLYRVERQVLAQIDRLWPSALLKVNAFQKAHPQLVMPEPLVRGHALQSKFVQALLLHRPNPYQWLPARQEDIIAFYHEHQLRCGTYWADRLLQVLQRSLRPAPPVAELLAEQLRDDFHQYLQLQQRLTRLLKQTDQIVPGSVAEVLTTLPGIAPYLAAQYVAFVGDVHRFQSAKQIWSMAGLEPLQSDSGDRRRQGKITKRGDPAFRRLLFSIGVSMSRACPTLEAAKQRALHHGKRKIGACIHAAHKANRILFCLLRDQVPFDKAKFH